MKKMTALLMIALLVGTMMSCQKQEVEEPGGLTDLPEKSASLIHADNQFGLNLFRRVTEIAEERDNTLISPLSVSLALSMVYNGRQVKPVRKWKGTRTCRG